MQVLRKHGIITKQGDLIKLTVGKLSFNQKAELKRICEERLQVFAAKKGLAIWDYRFLDETPVDNSLRYRVLKDSKGRCALCGSTKNDTMLDVDHIIPHSKGGKTVYENLQVLCAKCNRSKRDKDRTDFRKALDQEYDAGCIFCNAEKNREIVAENELCLAFPDNYPVTEGHTLITPRRHITDYFEMSEAERTDANDLIRVRRLQLLESDARISGFNIGVNCGPSAGQTISHCHIHLIPRRQGDTPNPEGGIRSVIPEKIKY